MDLENFLDGFPFRAVGLLAVFVVTFYYIGLPVLQESTLAEYEDREPDYYGIKQYFKEQEEIRMAKAINITGTVDSIVFHPRDVGFLTRRPAQTEIHLHDGQTLYIEGIHRLTTGREYNFLLNHNNPNISLQIEEVK